jgi:hypothetical protein
MNRGRGNEIRCVSHLELAGRQLFVAPTTDLIEGGLLARHAGERTANTDLSLVNVYEVERGVLLRGPIGGQPVDIAHRR